MKILSFDIGIKNLAYCICECDDINKTVNILEWDIINLIEDEINNQEKCSHISRNKPYKRCNNIANFKISNNTEYFCKNHKKNYKKYISPLIKKIENKTNICCTENCNKKYKYEVNGKLLCPSCKKQIETHFKKNFTLKKIKTIKCNKYPIGQIADKMITILDEKYSYFIKSDIVLLENQPCFTAPKMKTVSNYLSMYFRIRGKHDDKESNLNKILYYKATNKLEFNKNNTNEDKKTYKNRKNIGIKNVNSYLLQQEDTMNYEKFNNHKKKDDLADSLLQILSYIYS